VYLVIKYTVRKKEKFIMNFEKIFAKIKFCVYTAMALAGLGFILLVIGLIAKSVLLDVFGILFILGGGALFIYVYPEQAKYSKIKKARDYILSQVCVTEVQLANQLSTTETKARGLIDFCFRKGCLPGYIRKGQKIYHHEEYAEEKAKAGKEIVAVDCPNCGANFKAVKGEPGECPYCGSYINL
jgi:hypothetical protein